MSPISLRSSHTMARDSFPKVATVEAATVPAQERESAQLLWASELPYSPVCSKKSGQCVATPARIRSIKQDHGQERLPLTIVVLVFGGGVIEVRIGWSQMPIFGEAQLAGAAVAASWHGFHADV